MIILDNANRSLQLVLGGSVTTNQLDVAVYFYDAPQRTKDDFSDYHRVGQYSVSDSTTDVEICSAPVANYIRTIESIFIFNKDVDSTTVTVKKDDAGTEHILVRVELAAGETLFYDRESGWGRVGP